MHVCEFCGDMFATEEEYTYHYYVCPEGWKVH